jgi:hypothetical protein
MVDIDLLVQALREKGHTVQYVHRVPDNAGEYEFTIDGEYLNLEEARRVLELDSEKSSPSPVWRFPPGSSLQRR